MSKSKFKAMMIVFFDIRGVIYIDWVPEGQTVNQVYYKNVLTNSVNVCDEGDQTCGRMPHGFFITTTRYL